MYYYLVAPATVVRKEDEAFTYHSDKPLAIGTVVRVPVGKKLVTGLVMSATKKPSFATKSVGSILAPRPLPAPLLELARWLSDFYATHFGLVLQTMLPAGVHKKRRAIAAQPAPAMRKRTTFVLNKEQANSLLIANRHTSGTLLLHGVTGSGKTQVYIEAAKHEHRQGRSSIILVPEIALTPQLVAEFTHHFKKIIVAHSVMTEPERHHAWSQALISDEPLIVIGPRSALFLPVQHLGLVVVDECHEPSYKQELSPRYSALRTASMLARFHGNAKAILGSATPSVTDYYLAKTTKRPVLRLSAPAQKAQASKVQVVDLKTRDAFKEHRFLSDELVSKMRQALGEQRQVLLFHNRRGTAPTTLCTTCGWLAECPNCHLPLTLHADRHKLICHLCGKAQPVPPHCPMCQQPDVVFKGLGTKLIEGEVRKLFPKATVARFDADSSAQDTVQSRYQQLYDGDIDIAIGTQLLAKGLDLPKLAVVGIIQADAGLHLPDYQAAERVFQLLHQASGRVGRNDQESHVIIQTFQPTHYAVQHSIAGDYAAFYQQQLQERQAGRFPPFVHLLKLVCSYKTERSAVAAAQKLAASIRSQWPEVLVQGPTPAFHERLGGNYRWQLLIKSKQRAPLQAIAKSLPAHWQFDLDPASLL